MPLLKTIVGFFLMCFGVLVSAQSLSCPPRLGISTFGNATFDSSATNCGGLDIYGLPITKTTTTTTTTTTTAAPTTTTRQTTTSTPIATTTTTLAIVNVSLVKGWNLIGNGMDQNVDVSSVFGDSNTFTTVWKWVSAKTVWAFYAPSMNTANLTAYAGAKGYDVLTTINAGDGFWVNTSHPTSVKLPYGSRLSSARFGPTGSTPLPKGWSLIAIGDSLPPNDFNLALGGISQSSGGVPINVTTLWAWDAEAMNWIFYAPSLLNAGALDSYIGAKLYESFGSKSLTPTVGFWVNKP